MSAISDSAVAGIFDRVIGCFRSEHIPYVIIGAWALAAWGRPRATTDVDFMALTDERNLRRLSDRLVRIGMVFDEAWAHWNPMLGGIQLRFHFQGVTVDVLRARDSHDRQVFRRKRKRRMDGRYYWLVSAEDLVLQKLKVGRPKDFDDALSILERAGRVLDEPYLMRWAGRLGISGELRYLLALLRN